MGEIVLSLLGCKSGFQSLVKNVSPEVVGTHCMIHRQIFATKTFPEPIKEVLNRVIKAVNVVKSRPLHGSSEFYVKIWVQPMKYFCFTQR